MVIQCWQRSLTTNLYSLLLISSQDGYTPLHIAAQQGHSETVIKLIQEGRANVEAVSKVGVCSWFMCYVRLGRGKRNCF